MDPAVDSEQSRQDFKTYLFAGHSIPNVSALEVLRNRALQIDIYLLTYLLTAAMISDVRFPASFVQTQL